MNKAVRSIFVSCGFACLFVFIVLCSASNTGPQVLGKVQHQTNSLLNHSYSPTNLERLSATELINSLQDEATEGAGTHSTAWADTFMALEETPQFRGGILGSAKPVTSPVMREIVRRGIGILPNLIEHLRDARPTKLIIKHSGGFGAMWHDEEYQPRSADPRKRPPSLKPDRDREPFPSYERRISSYIIRVGDLCAVAIGQIVNRSLSAVRYQPSLCLVINSPVETSALALAIEHDWAGLTLEKHLLSLCQDALSLHPYEAGAAIKRLAFYYPIDAQPLILKLLNRPLVDNADSWSFIANQLLKESLPAKWQDLIQNYRQQYGAPAAEMLPFRLYGQNWGLDNGDLALRYRAEQILNVFYPDFAPFTPSFINAVNPHTQAELIASLANFPSEKLDQAIYRVFQSARNLPISYASDSDTLCFACLDRLAGKGYDAELRSYLETRRKQELALPRAERLTMTLTKLEEWQKRLSK